MTDQEAREIVDKINLYLTRAGNPPLNDPEDWKNSIKRVYSEFLSEDKEFPRRFQNFHDKLPKILAADIVIKRAQKHLINNSIH